MTADKILQFIIGHNGTIIWVLFALILLLTIFVAFKIFFSSHGTDATASGGVGANFSQIEESLKKILEGGVSVGAATGGGASSEELDAVKAELSRKEQELQSLRAQGAGASKEESSRLEEKIKELEGRLAEYEIIAEDIADLSRYKEENIRLKKELDQYRAGGPVVQQVAPVSAPTPAPQAPVAPSPVANVAPVASLAPAADPFESALASMGNDTPAEPVAPAPVAAAPAPDDNFIDDDIMAEFAKAVEAQKAGSLENKKEEAPAPAPVAAASAIDPFDAALASMAEETPAEPVVAAPEVTLPIEEPAKEEAPGLGEDAFAIDVDKMVAEAASLEAAGDSVNVDNVLEASLDEDKLLAEAGLMAGGEDKAANKEKETAKLMGEFENFVGTKS